MRTIKFRGYGAGSWRYGYYVHFDNRPKTSDTYNRLYRDFIVSQSKWSESHVPVDPKSVGQFTGLTDKDDREIYEGDIISYEEFMGRKTILRPRVVAWSETINGWATVHDGIECELGHLERNYGHVAGNIYEDEPPS